MLKKLGRLATLLLAFSTVLALPASAATIGWNQNSNGYYYYVNSNGNMMVNGWISDHGNWYHVDYSGAMETGWVYDSGYWYYFNTDGTMHTDWLYDGYDWYYFNTNGVWLY